MKPVGIIARVDKPSASVLVASVREALEARGVPVLFEQKTAGLAGGAARGVSERELAAECGLLVVLGGDGTILRLVHHAGGTVPPIFGINLGSLGFLTGVGGDEWLRAVDSIAAGDYRLSDRTLLSVRTERGGETFTGLNDVVVSRGHHSELIKVEVRVDGEEFCDYNADGLIVATPTGSTAYSMSAGGPLLLPDSHCLVLTPICPHVLTNRSTVMADTARLELRLAGGSPGVTVNVDGREIREFRPGDILHVSRAEGRIQLATLPGRTFGGVLRDKLKWSGSNV